LSESAFALIREAEERKARALGRGGRRTAGVYYTPASLAARVLEIALEHGSVRSGRVLDPCAGAGAFLVAAARAGFRDVGGLDLDRDALRVARSALKLCGIARPSLRRADSLRFAPRLSADLLVSNPPYGHVESVRERRFLARVLPALRGGEIDRYAAFILRSLQLVRPGGTAALLVPDTWMFLARAGALREAILTQAEVAALVDLGKPFVSAKDTRVQALVLVRRPWKKNNYFFSAHVGRGREALAPASREELVRTARAGWFVYRSPAERALCEAMEAASVPLREACEVGYGMRTGDNGRHVGRRAPRAGEVGLAGGEDVVPFALRWRPKTLLHGAPLQKLVERQRGSARICVQRIRTNSTAPWARWLEAAPVPAELVCLDSLSTLACADEERLWALLALVSSVAMNRYHRLRTTDVNVKPSALRELPVPHGLLREPGELAALAKKRAASAGMSAHLIDRRIDAQVYALFGLREELVHASERGFWADRSSEEIRQLEDVMSDPPATVARKEKNA
jgi:SAM-dependent methyltransferase